MPDQRVIKLGNEYAARRLVEDEKRPGHFRWEWLTLRGWRPVRGGSHGTRRPKDVLLMKVHHA